MNAKELHNVYLYWLSRNFCRAFIKPDYVGILLTKRCNLKCVMCDIRKYPTNIEEELTLQEIKKIIDDVALWKVHTLTLSGGEPFLRKDFFDIADYAIRKIRDTAINTNLTCINEELAIKLTELPKYNKFHLEISLDGATAKTHDAIRGVEGCFDKIISNINLIRRVCKERGADVQIGVTSLLMKENFKEAFDLARISKELKLANLSFMPIMDSNVEKDVRTDSCIMNNKEIRMFEMVIGELIEFKRRNGLIINPESALKLYPNFFQKKIINKSIGCYAGILGPNVCCPGGEVFICKYLIGTINKSSVRDLWYSSRANRARRTVYNCKYPCLQHYTVPWREVNNPLVATYQYIKENITERIKKSFPKELKLSKVNLSPKGSRFIKNRKINIVISDTARLYPPLWGGPRRIWHLFSNLKKELFDITYVGVDYRLSNGKNYTFNRMGDNFKEILFGFPKHYYPWYLIEKKLVRNSTLDLFSYLYMHTHRDFKDAFNMLNADILICSHPWSSLSMNKRDNQLFIYDAHNCEYLLMDQILGNHILKPLILKMVKHVEADACKKADIIAVCSDSEKKSFIDIYNVEPSRLHVIPNGSYVRPIITEQEKQDAKKEFGIDTGRKALIFIGAHYKPNIDAAKFILEMLAPEFPEFIFLIAGSVVQEFKDLKVPSNIKFLGEVSDERLFLALKAADIALNPMFMGSGVNIKMLDYMSCGLPTITTECGARGLDVDGKQPMVICSIAKFVDNIRNLSNDNDLYKRMSLDARSLVSEKYDWKAISNRLQNIILEKFK